MGQIKDVRHITITSIHDRIVHRIIKGGKAPDSGIDDYNEIKGLVFAPVCFVLIYFDEFRENVIIVVVAYLMIK